MLLQTHLITALRRISLGLLAPVCLVYFASTSYLQAEDKKAESDASAEEQTPKLSAYEIMQQDLYEHYPEQRIWVDVGGDKVVSLYLPDTSGQNLGGVLLLPDVGTHPNWRQAVGPLRQRLPAYGWHTLALMPPHPEKKPPRYIVKKAGSPTENGSDSDVQADANSADPETTLYTAKKKTTTYSTRISPGTETLKTKGIGEKLIAIGQGEGAYWALAQANELSLAGVVLIDIREPASAPQGLADLWANLSVPVLDLYYAGDESSAQKRRLSANANPGVNLRQVRLALTRSASLNNPDYLAKLISGWARKGL